MKVRYYKREKEVYAPWINLKKRNSMLTIPLYPKVANESVTKTINFKESIVNVKLKDISIWATGHLSKNWVTERTKTLRKVS